MNKYYCQSGHSNFASNGKKPSFCGTCGAKMGASSFSAPTPTPAPQPTSTKQFRVFNQPVIEESYDEIPDIDGLSFELEIDDATVGVTADRIAVGAPTTQRPKGKKMSKAASKSALNTLLSNARANVSKEI